MSSRLRTQLNLVGERFVGFDDAIADEAKRRREEDEKRYKYYLESLDRLQMALNSEMQRQCEASKAMRESLQKMSNDMLIDLQRELHSRLDKYSGELHKLLGRCETLEKGLAEMKGHMPSQLQTAASVLFRDIRQLAEAVEGERDHCVLRDDQIFHALGQLEQGFREKVQSEVGEREEQFCALKAGLDSLSRGEDSKVQQFRRFVLEELSSLKNGLVLASQAREQSDDEILLALQQYTQSLQKGMRMRLLG